MTDICRAVGFLIKIIYSSLLIPHDYSGEKQLKINADNSFFDVYFLLLLVNNEVADHLKSVVIL